MPELDRKDAAWLAALVILVLVFFHQFVFGGLIPINADWLQFHFEPGRSHLQGITPHNVEVDDPINQFYPLRLEAVRQWKSGALPLWNPGIFCGNPLLADGISKPFDPLIVCWLVFGGPIGHSLELVLQFVLMAAGMYLLARALGLPRPGAAIAAAVYTFNLFSVTWMEFRTVTGAFAFFPWAFLFLVAALDRASRRYAALSGLFGAFMAFSGHPQLVFYGFVLLVAFVIWRALEGLASGGARPMLRALGYGALAVGLALALSAVETVSFLELTRHSAHNPRKYELANLWSTPASFIPYLYPNFFGNPARGAYLGGGVLMRPYMTATAGFVGAATLVLALAGLFIGRLRDKRFFAGIVIVVPFVLLASGAGLGHLLSQITHFFSGMDVARLVFFSNVAFAVLAGAGGAALAEADWRAAAHRHLAVSLVLVVLIVAAATATLERTAPSLSLADNDQTRAMLWFVDGVNKLAGNALFWPAVSERLQFAGVAMALVLLAPFAKRAAAPIAFGLVAFELISVAIGYNPYVPASMIAPRFEPLSVVKVSPGDGRVLGIDTGGNVDLVATKGDWLVPNTALLYGLEDIRGDETPRLARYQKYVLRIVRANTDIGDAIHFPFFESPLVDALNVKYVFSAMPLRSRRLTKLFDDGKSFVYENTRAFPRAYLVGYWEAAPSDTAALKLVQSRAEYRLPATIVAVEPKNKLLPAPPDAFPGGTAVIERYLPSHVWVRTSCPTVSMLVLADAYYHGWHATIDGRETPVMPADCALRAVCVPAGDHLVKFVYRPASLIAGALVSAAAAFAIAVMLARSRRRTPAA